MTSEDPPSVDSSTALVPDTSVDPMSPKEPENPSSRLHFIMDVLIFQFKLLADGLRDIALTPLVLISALLGLFIGGRKPYKYFNQVLTLGRRTEAFINLFGRSDQNSTADDLVAPIKTKISTSVQNTPWLSDAGTRLNKTLDNVNDSLAKPSNRRLEKPSDNSSQND